MENTKPKKSLIKRIRNIVLILLGLIILIYVIINIVFWKKGMPERYFDYEVLENDTIEIEHYTGPFFLLNIPDTIEGKPVTSIGNSIFAEPLYENGKYDTKYYVMYKYVTAIHLPDTVEEIHACAFSHCTNLRTINIPPKLKYAGELILVDTKIRKLVFPDGITEIGCGPSDIYKNSDVYESFSGMKYLREVQFPQSLKKIGDSAFSDCTALKSIIIPNSVEEIETCAFMKCTYLKKVTLPDSIEEIGYGAFQDSDLTEVNIPKSLVKNGGCIFRNTPFEETLEKEAKDDFIIFNDVLLYKYIGEDENVVIPDGIESICDRAFLTSPNVKTVEIPESVRYINGAFNNSTIENLVIPDSIEDIDSYAFCKCTALKKIVITASVKEIGEHAFDGCTSLKEVVIEGSPKIGEDAFKDCHSLVNKPEY
ncbi:MAG: leucine-rich repeat domain-containing protein [Ruminococcus sp.]|uniref:leucine-rich repeat domain-containing protein n=1 Tax=Ruminococcus sp. TaxID=41978 RepID=UPI0025D58ED1|nr:leucine-rich repeat domain-containing protein [Ruminococcus sp.]MBO4867304.1 leucine-rich repeat domain-containing protein [Ruminococcus sp.]